MRGYEVHRSAIPSDLVEGLQRSVVGCYATQARKLRVLRDKVPDGTTVDDLDIIVTLLEDEDRRAGYEALSLVAQSQGARAWAAWSGWADLAPFPLLLVTPPSVFVNLPSSERLLYRWHREEHYYPKRRTFLNAWSPLFSPRDTGNGPLRIAVGSHLLGDLPFAEHGGNGTFRQFEVMEEAIAGCEVITIDAEPGDIVTFDRRTVHASTPNASDRPSYAVVCRLWDPTNDLTLSGDIAATPYGGDYGRGGMVL